MEELNNEEEEENEEHKKEGEKSLDEINDEKEIEAMKNFINSFYLSNFQHKFYFL